MVVGQDHQGRLPSTHLSLGSKGQVLRSLSGLDPQDSRVHSGLPEGLVLPFELHLGQCLLQLPKFSVEEGGAVSGRQWAPRWGGGNGASRELTAEASAAPQLLWPVPGAGR